MYPHDGVSNIITCVECHVHVVYMYVIMINMFIPDTLVPNNTLAPDYEPVLISEVH